MTKISRFKAAVLALALMVAMPGASSSAAEILSYSGSYTKSITTPDLSVPYSLSAYNIAGSTIELDYFLSDNLPPAITGSGKVNMTCVGTSEDNGGWEFTIEPGSVCWNAFAVPCDGVLSGGCGAVPERPITPDDVKITPRSLCAGSFLGLPTEKEYCAFGSGVTGNTNDDMFAIAPGAAAYLEYMKLGPVGEPARLKYIRRAGTVGSSMMMPSGPDVTYDDYNQFINTPPATAGVTVTNACYAVDVTVCEDAMFELPDAQCGVASGVGADGAFLAYFASADGIPPAALCSVGLPSDIQDLGGYFTWVCRGEGESGECKAGKALNCGYAHNQIYNEKAEILAADLCVGGTASEITGTGPWNWTCTSSAPGTPPKSCEAMASMGSCDSNIGDVVFILDDSNSMKGMTKFTRAKSAIHEAMRQLVEKKSRQLPDSTRICMTGMQFNAFVEYEKNKGCGDKRAYAAKRCGVPVSQGGNEKELSADRKNQRCINYWDGVFHSPADPESKPIILENAETAVESFNKTALSTPMYRRAMQAADYLGSGIASKPNKIIVVSDGNDVAWEKDKDLKATLAKYKHIKLYVLLVVDRAGQVDNKLSGDDKNVAAIAKATGGFYAEIWSEDTDGFQAVMNRAVMGCETP